MFHSTKKIKLSLFLEHTDQVYLHYQPVNVPAAGAQAFLIDYTHHVSPVRIGGCYLLQMQPGLTA
jgi:hypothetical protein